MDRYMSMNVILAVCINTSFRTLVSFVGPSFHFLTLLTHSMRTVYTLTLVEDIGLFTLDKLGVLALLHFASVH